MLLFSRISGATGSGKTLLLKALKSRGEQILDLEDLAKHKGKNAEPLPNPVIVICQVRLG